MADSFAGLYNALQTMYTAVNTAASTTPPYGPIPDLMNKLTLFLDMAYEDIRIARADELRGVTMPSGGVAPLNPGA